MTDYQWTVESAIWQVQHGGPTHKTLSAINWLNELDRYEQDESDVAGRLLEALTEQRGLQHLGEALKPLPDETETVTP